MNHWAEGQVFGSDRTFATVEEARAEVKNILQKVINSKFEKIGYNGLVLVDKDYTAILDDGAQLIGRLDGNIFDEANLGQFYIEIVKSI